MINPAKYDPPPIPQKPAGLRPANAASSQPPQIPPKPVDFRPANPDPSLQPPRPPLTGRVLDPRKSTILSSKPLGKIYRFFLRRLGQTEKITQAKAMAAEFIEQDKIDLEEHITANVTRLKTAPKVSDYQELSDGIPRAKLPPERSLEAWRTAFEKKPIMNKVEAAKIHVNRVVEDIQEGNSASRLESLDGKGWTGLRISKDGAGFTITEGHVSTTSERSTGTDNHSDLFNIYVHVAENGHIAITTAVIDTPRRAEEFMQAVTYALKHWKEANPGKTLPPPRIAMHQLNTHGVVGSLKLGEISLIEGENRMMTYMNLRFPAVLKNAELESSEGPHFIHKNHAMNASSMLPQEAALSARNNLQGTAGQMLWLGQKIENVVTNPAYAQIRQNISEIQQKLIGLQFQALPEDELTELGLRQLQEDNPTKPLYEELHTLKDNRQDVIDAINELITDPPQDVGEIDTLHKNLVDINKQISGREKQIARIEKPFKKDTQDQIQSERKNLHQQLSQLWEIQKELVASESVPDVAKEALELGNIILEDQLKYDTQNLISKRKFVSDILSVANPLKDRDLSQTQRVALDLLLDQQLGITTQTNCKSSCDRTAVARALIECLPRITSPKDPESLATPAEQREFILNLEQGVRNMDAAFRGSGYETMQEFLHSSHSLPAFKSLYKFQVDMFNQLLAVGLPITGRSTGLEGLKFSHDTGSMGKNFHPLPLIPLEIYDEATGKTVQLVAFEKRNVLLKWGSGDWQSDRKLTDAGNWVLMGNAQGRGT